ncbi:MAG: dihydroorotase [Rhodospirillaceae bacterium]|nr:dihydroorotase [Rhodospirillaceae bacterium]
MKKNYDLIIKNGNVISHHGELLTDIAIKNGKIIDLGNLDKDYSASCFDAKGLTVLPGLIDTQVHFREPGFEQAEDLESGTKGAVLGGITGIFEMPNTNPPTDTKENLNIKIDLAEKKSWCNYAFYVGATKKNIDYLNELEKSPGCCGVKIFMGASTGNLLVPDDKNLEKILSNVSRRVAVHCEDNELLEERKHLKGNKPHNHPIWRDEETAFKATKRLLNIARKLNKRVHVLHITTAKEIELLKSYKDIATVEVTPQHLTLYSPNCYDRLGTYAQMNPPIRSSDNMLGLIKAVKQGVVDIIGSDHAPHTKENKEKAYPFSPSGMPGVQTIVPMMLDHVSQGNLSIFTLVDLMSYGPAKIFGLINKGRIAVGYDADLTIVDLNAKKTISNQWIVSKCGWTQFDNFKVRGWPIATIINGSFVMKDGDLLSKPKNKQFKFFETQNI